MFSTLRFLINKPMFLVPVAALAILALTTHKPPHHRHVNPWALPGAVAAASDAASDEAGQDDGSNAEAAASDSASGSASQQ